MRAAGVPILDPRFNAACAQYCGPHPFKLSAAFSQQLQRDMTIQIADGGPLPLFQKLRYCAEQVRFC